MRARPPTPGTERKQREQDLAVYTMFRDQIKPSPYSRHQHQKPHSNTPNIVPVSTPVSAVNWFKLAKTWDQGSKSVRERILREFVKCNRNKTGPQLESDFGNSASLFLIRLTSWFRLTYLLGNDIVLLLDAIGVFLSASSGQRFLLEFMEVGGVLTTLEVLGISRVQDVEKTAAMRLLLTITQHGRKYKEFICESYGIRAVSDCLLRSTDEQTQHTARNLLFSLGQGNPKFIGQIFKSLIIVLTSKMASPTSQQLAAQALRLLLPSMSTLPPNIVDASMNLLKSVHLQVQYEGYELLRELMSRPVLQDSIIVQLIESLRAHSDMMLDALNEGKRSRKNSMRRRSSAAVVGIVISSDEKPDEVSEAEMLTASYIQQSYAAKLLGVMAATNKALCDKIIDRQCVSALLVAACNTKYPDSQRYASNTILFLAQKNAAVQRALVEGLGHHFWEMIEKKPDTFFTELSRDQMRAMIRNQVIVQSGTLNASPARSRRRSSHLAGGLTVGEGDAAAMDGVSDTETDSDDLDSGSDTSELQNDDSANVQEKPAVAAEAEKASEEEKQEETTSTGDSLGDMLYKPMMNVSINQTLSGTKNLDDDETTKQSKFYKDLEAIKESARQNNNIAKLSLERKTEIDVILSEQSRISKATDATTFKADLATIIKNGVTAQEEEEETRPQTGVVNLEIIPSIEENQ